MRRFEILVSLLLLLASPVHAASERDNYRYACTQVSNLLENNSCQELPAPQVVYTLLLDYMKANGMYMTGENVIFVNPRGLDPDRIMVHEMTHYILWFNGIRDKCTSESLARYVAGQPGDKWRVRYGCIKEETSE